MLILFCFTNSKVYNKYKSKVYKKYKYNFLNLKINACMKKKSKKFIRIKKMRFCKICFKNYITTCENFKYIQNNIL